jgi:tetratricopeptide (TPR) repeat protein
MPDIYSMPLSLYGVPEIEDFVGRKEELSHIEDAFHGDGSERSVVVLQGLGGIGKTQLAIKYLKIYRARYSAIFWLNGKTEYTLKQSFVAVAKRLHRQHKGSALLKTALETEDIQKAVLGVSEWLSIQENHRWILVFDNVDNPKTPGSKDPQAYDVRSYFPEAYHGSIIVTTRSSSLKIGQVISVRKLQDIEESIMILIAMSGRPNLGRGKQAEIPSKRCVTDLSADPHVRKLARELDGLPLALATAGAYLGQVSTSLEEYLGHYTGSWLKLQKTSPELLSYEDRTLYSTWNLSLEYIMSQNELAAQLLRLWAYLDNQDVWYQLLAAGRTNNPEWLSSTVQDELSFNHVIRLLCDHGLVEPFEGLGGLSRGYSMHSCVHHWTKSVLGGKSDVELERTVLSCVVASIPCYKDPKRCAIQRRLLPHAIKCVEVVQYNVGLPSDHNQQYIEDLVRLGWLLSDQGKLKEAEIIFQRALDSREKVLGPEHVSTLDIVHNLGNVYAKQDKLKEAMFMHQRALQGYEKVAGPNHSSTLHTVHDLGNLYHNQGELKEAVAMYQRALHGKEKSLGPEHISTLGTVLNLGIIYQDRGQLKEAELMFQHAHDGYVKSLGPAHILTLDTVNSLATLYLDQGKLNEAETLYQRALDGYEKSLGVEHTSTLNAISNLSNLYQDQGRMKEAEVMCQRALDGFEKLLGKQHSSTLNTVNNLGTMYRDQGRFNEAEILYQRALDEYEKSLGTEHASTLRTVNNLGILYQSQYKMKDAELMYKRALDSREKTLGPAHKSTLNTIYNLSGVYELQRRYEEAEALMRRTVEGYAKSLGLEDPQTLNAMKRLGNLLRLQDKIEEADILIILLI